VSVGLILALGVLFGSLGFFLIERPARAAAGRRERRLHFTEAMQVARTEIEAHDVVKRHLERALPRTRTAVLRRNNSANRLEPATVLDDASPLLTTLDGAAPDACMAIRLGKTYQRGANAEALLACEICGAISSDSTCVPSLVGGEVIGSVLVEHEGALGEHQRDEVSAAVNDAAPVIANLHNLARAELRAATDALTGLPNNRAIQETIKRMVAQATRSSTPMSAVIFDLDHFKQVNDTFGHAAGDEVLAAVGVLAASTVRESDFVGRYGGEEFVMLLPETAVDGAVLAADKLRRAISTIKVPGVDRHLTASFGVATLPDDADDSALLLRAADRALYAAKKAGRDRVETVEALAEVDGAPAA